MVTENADSPESRPPTLADLLKLCRSLNENGARYLVVGGFAVNYHGYARATMDIDLLIESSADNQARVKKALEVLPDKAVLEIADDDINEFIVIRIGDEIVVDLMAAACGIDYGSAAGDLEYAEIEGVRIPMASAKTLLRMKQTQRSKDEMDRLFLQRLLAERK